MTWLGDIVFTSSLSYRYIFGGLTSGRYDMSRLSLSLISCKLLTVVQVLGLSQHHQLVGGVAVVTFLGSGDRLRCRPSLVGAWDLGPESPR